MPKKLYVLPDEEEVKEVKVISPEEAAANEKARAEHVAKTVDAQVVGDARKQEEDAIQAGKETELLEDQVWEERQDGNPFVRPLQASIVEVRKNSTEQVYVKFVAVHPSRTDIKTQFEYLAEEEFRARFLKQVK